MWLLSLYSVIAFIIVWISKCVYKWRNPSSNGKLPPGSMGLPLVGEMFQLLKSHSSFDIHPFFKDRVTRYGPLFKTNLFGNQAIVSTDPEIIQFLLLQHGRSVETVQLGSTFKRLLGQNKLATSTGAIHKYIRNIILDHISFRKHNDTILSETEALVRKHLDIWSKQESVEVKQVSTKMLFEISSKKFLNYDHSRHPEDLEDKFPSITKSLASFSINFPGFLLHKALRDKKRAIKIIKDIVKERLFSTRNHVDFLDAVINEMKKDEPLFDIDSAAEFLFALLFVAIESSTMAIPLAVKFISEHPLVLKGLTDEHESILQNKPNRNSPLTWKDYTSMTFTSHVIDETLRLANIAPMFLRRATRDIEIQGYTIPAGWLIMLSPANINLNPEKYEDPLAFNPWRWEGQRSIVASKNYVPFGRGQKECVGAEFIKLEMALAIHFLVSKYRWVKIKGGEIVKTPAISFPNGLHIKVSERN